MCDAVNQFAAHYLATAPDGLLNAASLQARRRGTDRSCSLV
eukprot:SAG31_NODE_13903_length_838_cov_1.557510_1_plen_40_part_10